MIDFLLEILWELQDIPGLRFLRNFREAINTKRSELQRKKHQVDVRRRNLAGTKDRLKAIGKGSKRRDE